MKILLTYQSGLSHRKDPYISLLPTGLCYLHACLQKAGHDSLLANFSAWSNNRIKQELLRFRPDVVGISQWTHNRHVSVELAGLCRELLPDCTIIMGGAHATFCYEDVLVAGSPVDIVIRGEAEATLLELIAALKTAGDWQNIAGIAYRHNGKIAETIPRKNIENLDQLPLPAQFIDRSVGVDLELQTEFIVTTRGCPSACYFCSSPDFWGRKVRFRSPEAIVEEILYIRQQYGLIYFSIRDDTFTADRKRVLEFCRLLKSQNANILWNCQSRVSAIDEELVVEMKRAGCECIQLGVESGSPRILKQLGKNITPEQITRASALIREIGISLSIYLISDIPGETGEDIKQTLELLRLIRPDDGYVSPLAYYPGTKLFKDAAMAGIVSPDLFSNTHRDALYAITKPGKTSARLMGELTKIQQREPGRFDTQKERLGFCYTTNVIASEWFRQRGEYGKAEKELREITSHQPDNPWGWFLLGDLYSELGKATRGRECYSMALKIVPQHGPSKAGQSAE